MLCCNEMPWSHFDELVHEAKRCAKQQPTPRKEKQEDKHTIDVFTCLMLRGTNLLSHEMTDR